MAALGISTAQVKRVAPALKDAEPTLQADFAAMQASGIAAYLDFGDFHRYTLSSGGTSPSSLLDQRISWAKPAYGDKDLLCTETGFNTADYTQNLGWRALPWDIQALYAKKVFLETFSRGVVRTYQYELLDDPEPLPRDQFEANQGLVYVADGDLNDPSKWVKKDAFSAIANLISMTADPGANYVPKKTGLQIAGGGSDLRHLVLQKRTGKNLLVIWRDVSLWNNATKTKISISPVKVTVKSDAVGAQTVDVAGDVYFRDL